MGPGDRTVVDGFHLARRPRCRLIPLCADAGKTSLPSGWPSEIGKKALYDGTDNALRRKASFGRRKRSLGGRGACKQEKFRPLSFVMKNRRLLLHLGFWLAYILYDGYLGAPLSGSSFDGLGMWSRFGMAYFAQLCLLPIKASAVYLVLYRLLPERFSPQRLLIFAGQILLVAFVATALSQLVWYRFLYPQVYGISAPGEAANGWIALFRWLYNALDILFLLGLAIALKLLRLRQQSEVRERRLIEEKLQSELHFLRAQTNPHFLFNTLNNLYHLARKRSEDTPEAILKLSGLLRFMLYECGSDRIPLRQEVQVIRDYLELERLRYDERLQLQFEVELDNERAPIAPLLLLPLVENAFKHGASESTGRPEISMTLRERGGRFTFSVRNTVDGQSAPASDGIGLRNVRRQLELLYPSHRLDVAQQDGLFSVKLELDLYNPTT